MIFGGGIGEHSERVRAGICADLEWIGLEIDRDRNHGASGREVRISTDHSRIAIYVIPMDEELYMARAALRLLADPRKDTSPDGDPPGAKPSGRRNA